MSAQPERGKSPSSLARIIRALFNSWAAIRHGFRNEAALREEMLLLAVLGPASLFMPVSRIEHLLLVVSLLFVLAVEFLNTAVETAVDRISTERHPLAGQAKDMASAAVLVSLLIWAATWGTILVPVLAARLR